MTNTALAEDNVLVVVPENLDEFESIAIDFIQEKGFKIINY